jgi:PAS domain S-box-containing protein
VSQEPSAAPVQPLRFVWQTDSNGRFMLESNEFKPLIGPKATAALGQPWSVIAATLRLDPEGQVARALASRETWSRITVAFPAEGTDARLAVELSGLPVFDRDRSFRGYRGFGVCRHAARIAALTRKEPAGPPAPRPQADAPVNIVQFPPSAPADGVPTLTSGERRAFSELASRLSARLHGADKARPERPNDAAAAPPSAEKPADAPPRAVKAPAAERPARAKPEAATRTSADPRPILDRLPIGVLVYRLDRLIYANRAFLEWTGYEQLHALEEAGGLDALFVEPNDEEPVEGNGGQSLTIATNQGDQVPVAARLFTAPWDGESALVLMLSGVGGDEPQQAFGTAPHEPEAETGNLRAILDAAADGVVVIDRDNRVQSISTGGARLFGYARREAAGLLFTNLFMPESQRRVLHALDRSGTAQAGGRGNGCDVIGRHREGMPVPLFMMLSPIEGDGDRLCAVFRDMTAWKKAESELHYARRQTEQALAAKSDFLAKISHEIRTPLNAIIGFSEVMMQERFGAIGNERYRQYLKDIHTSGGHLIALLNDLLDLSKIEAGKLDLDFSDVDLNELTQQSVALMQPQATRERIIIRTSLGSALPTVSADARSVRQILLNLISNSIKFTGAGGQVIVSTARGEDGEVVLRVRDTGVGMNEQDLVAALEPFRRVATSAREGSGGIGLGLPLTKALAEANRARFKIKSAVDAGTLVEVAFPGGRLAAE